MKQQKQVSKAWGIASLVTSISGVILWFMPYFGLPLSIMAIVGASKQNKVEPTGVATAGNIIGIIGVVINAIVILIAAFVFFLYKTMVMM